MNDLIRRICKKIWIFFTNKLYLFVTILLLALLIKYHLYLNAVEFNRTEIECYYYNYNILNAYVDLEYQSVTTKNIDKIEIGVLITQNMTDSLQINYDREYYIYKDTLNNNKFEAYNVLKLMSAKINGELFQNRISTNIESNKEFSVSSKILDPFYSPQSMYSIHFKYNRLINKDISIINIDKKEELSLLSSKKNEENEVRFKSGNLHKSKISDKNSKIVNANYDYYLCYQTMPDTIINNTTIENNIFKCDRKGDINSFLKITINGDNNIKDLLLENNFFISCSSNYLLMNDIIIYPVPDKRTPSSFEFNSKEKLDEILNNGLSFRGENKIQKYKYNIINFWITFLIGALSTLLLTYFITFIEKHGKRKQKE